jgi:type I restriction enzyme S subunit
MNAERLLAQFERISEAPDAIPRLRRFILDLAVRGKLVQQDPENEPAEEQLERIIEAKILLGRKERMAKKKRSELSDQSLDYPLPARWATAPLADLVTVLNGRAYKQSELLDTGTPVLRVGNLFTSNKWYYSDLKLDEDKFCDDGDLIFAWSASFGPFIWNGGRAIYHYHIWKLPIHSPADLSRDYLYLYLLNKTDKIKASGHGISMVHMTKEKMERLEVPLPPLAEQHRIVAKVDELMALCDQLEAARQEQKHGQQRLVAASLQRLNQPAEDPATFRQQAGFALNVLPRLTTTAAEIKQLRQTILNLAVRGKLVEQDPEDEPAEIWFHKLRPLLAGSKDGKSQPPRDLPSGWQWLGFSDLFDVAGGIQKTPNRAPRSNSFPYLGVSNVYRGRLDLSAVKHFELEPGELDRRRLEAGDLLIIEGNGSLKEIGRCAKWGGEIENCVHQNHVIRCRPCSVEISDFAILFLNSPWGMEIMQQLAITSSGLYSLSVGKIRKIEIPLPPLAEQHRIVAKVDELMALCDQLEQQLNAGEQLSRKLLEAVVQEAVAGRLPEKSEGSSTAAPDDRGLNHVLPHALL